MEGCQVGLTFARILFVQCFSANPPAKKLSAGSCCERSIEQVEF